MGTKLQYNFVDITWSLIYLCLHVQLQLLLKKKGGAGLLGSQLQLLLLSYNINVWVKGSKLRCVLSSHA